MYQGNLVTMTGGCSPDSSLPKSSRASWTRPIVFGRQLFGQGQKPSCKPPISSTPILNFDCLYSIFDALCSSSSDSADSKSYDRSSETLRGFLYNPYEQDPSIIHPDLISCSLVCRAWFLPAQRRMLHTMRIVRANQVTALLSLLTRDRSAGQAVQFLEIGRLSDETRPSFGHNNHNISRFQLFELLRTCHRLRSLSLLQWRPDAPTLNSTNSKSPYLPPISFHVLSRHYPFERITTLRLHEYVGAKFSSLADLLVLMPALRSFSFEGRFHGTTREEVMDLANLPSTPAPFSLTRFSLSGYAAGVLPGQYPLPCISWLLSSSWHTLTRLDLGFLPTIIDPALLEGLQQAADEGKNNITSLSMTLAYADVPAFIRACPKLEKLRIDGTKGPGFLHADYDVLACLAALDDTPTSSTNTSTPTTSTQTHVQFQSLKPPPRRPTDPHRRNLIHLILAYVVQTSRPGSHTTYGRSPTSSDIQQLTSTLFSPETIPALSALECLTLEFDEEMKSYPDAPLTQLRALGEACRVRGVEYRCPDLYRLVMGPEREKGGIIGVGGRGGHGRSRSRTVSGHVRNPSVLG